MKRRTAKAIMILVVLGMVLLSPQSAAAAPDAGLRQDAQAQLDTLPLAPLEEYWQQLPPEAQQALPEGIRPLIEGEMQGGAQDGETALDFLKDYALNAWPQMRNFCVQLIAIVILSAVANAMQSGLRTGQSTNLVSLCTYACAMCLIIAQIASLSVDTAETIGQIGQWMELITPVLTILLVGLGGAVTSGIFQPMTLLLSGGIIQTIAYLVLPLTMASTAATVISHFAPKDMISKLPKLLFSLTKWTIGIVMTVFLAVMAIKGLSAASADGISLRTARYAAGSAIPVVGTMVADTMDTLIACSALVKNSIGTTGVLILFLIAALPVVKIFLLMVTLRLCSTVAQPLGEQKLSQAMEDLSTALSLLMACMITTAIMSIITITLFVIAGDWILMMR